MSLIETKEVKFYSSVDDFPKVGNELCVADGQVHVISGGKLGGIRQYPTLADLPTASEFVGVAQVLESNTLHASDGVSYKVIGTFTPSIYSGLKSATTTVTGQSEAVASGATKLNVVNKDATNSLYVGFGMSTIEAENACSNGSSGVDKFLLLADSTMLQFISDYSHYAWLGVGGTVSMRITQGV